MKLVQAIPRPRPAAPERNPPRLGAFTQHQLPTQSATQTTGEVNGYRGPDTPAGASPYSGFYHAFSALYFTGIVAAPVLMGFALWRSRSVARWLAVLFVLGLEAFFTPRRSACFRQAAAARACSPTPTGRSWSG
jgi:hypothetical protein